MRGGDHIQRAHLCRAAIIVWLILSVIFAGALAAPAVLPGELVHSLASASRSALHGSQPCPLCGMTTAFVHLSHGMLREALQANRLSLPLYALLAANELLALWVVSRAALRLLRAREPRPVRAPRTPPLTNGGTTLCRH